MIYCFVSYFATAFYATRYIHIHDTIDLIDELWISQNKKQIRFSDQISMHDYDSRQESNQGHHKTICKIAGRHEIK